MDLDSTASYRLYWKGQDTSNVVFLDRRAKVKPDIVADARALPFRDHVFDNVHSDPPHNVWSRPPPKRDKWKNHPSFRNRKFNVEHDCFTMPEIIAEKYSFFRTRTEMISFLYHTNEEYCRVLKASGTLHLKVIDGKTKTTINLRVVKECYTSFVIEEVRGVGHFSQLVKNHGLMLLMKPIGGNVKLGAVA